MAYIPQTMEELLTKLYTYTYGDNDVSVKNIKVNSTDEMTAYHVEVEIKIGDEPAYISPVDYYVPNFIRGSVSIPGENGKEKNRIQIYSARLDPAIRVTRNSVKLGKEFFYSFLNGYITLHYDQFTLNAMSVCKYYGVLDYVYPDADPSQVPDLMKDEIEALEAFEIEDKSLTKLQILFKDTEKLPNKISPTIIKRCFDMWMQPEKYDKMMPLDFIFMDAIQGLIYEIWYTHRADLLSYTRFNIMKNEAVYPSKLQHIIDNFFNMQSKTFHDIQVPQDSNAISLMTQSRKIYFFDRDMQRIKLYNNYFSGVLDPTKTTEGANININNELSYGCELSDGKLIMKVYDKNFVELQIPYEKYIMSPILSFSNIDYENKKVFPDDQGRYTYAIYGDYKYTTNLSDIKYYRHLDTQISPSTAVIPFVNQMAANRVMLCSHFVDQSIPVVGAKPPIVHTPATKRLFDESSMNIRSPISGTVVDILDDEHVKIRSIDGEERVVDSVRYINTSNHTTNEMNLTVKIGDKVKKDDVIFHMNSFIDNEFTTSVPLRTMFGTYEGRGFEDGIIISETAAKLLGHQRSCQLTKVLKLPVNSNVNEPGGSGYAFDPYTGTETDRYDMFGLIKPGQVINAGDLLFSYQQTLDKADSYAVLREAVLNDPTVRHGQKFTTPYNITGGVVRSANIYIQYDDSQNREFTNYYRNRVNDQKQRIKDFSGKLPLDFDFQDTATYAVVVVEVDYVQKVVLTDKFSNFYGSKGVSTFVIPDEERPLDEWGNPFDLIIHSFSQYSRGNPAQTRKAKLGLIGKDGYDWAVNHIDRATKKVIEFLKLAYPDDEGNINTKEDAQAYIDKYKKYGYFRFEVSAFDNKYTTDRMLKLLEMIGRPNAESTIYFPKYNKYSENKASIGIEDLMRLHFIADYKLKATGATRVSDDFVLGYGSYRDEGQRIGLQETWSWFGHGKGKELASLYEETGSDNKASKVLTNFIALGLKLVPKT